MPNRLRHQPIVFDIFSANQQAACAFYLWVSASRNALPAFHDFCSVLWEVKEGKTWVVYQVKDGDWSLGYLWPGQRFGACVRQPYFFIPEGGDVLLDGTTLYPQVSYKHLLFPDIKPPQEAFVNFPFGVLISTENDWGEIESFQGTSKVYWPDERWDELAQLAPGDLTDPFRYEVEIASWVEWATNPENELGFDPRIIDRPTQPAGSYAWELECERETLYTPLTARPRQPEHLTLPLRP